MLKAKAGKKAKSTRRGRKSAAKAEAVEAAAEPVVETAAE